MRRSKKHSKKELLVVLEEMIAQEYPYLTTTLKVLASFTSLSHIQNDGIKYIRKSGLVKGSIECRRINLDVDLDSGTFCFFFSIPFF